jgi:hypothetical protein
MPHTLTRKRAQAPRRVRRTDIPHPNGPNGVAVTDGCFFAGVVVESTDGFHYAFRPDDVLIGKFKTCTEAVRALPFADDIGEFDEYARVS